jgi:DNA repair protein RadC
MALLRGYGAVPFIEEKCMSTLFVRESEVYREATHDQVLTGAANALARRFRVGSPVLKDPSAAREFLLIHLATLPYEVFGCLYLNGRHRLLGREQLFRGTLDTASVHSREIIRSCLAYNAASLILYHNHPSGDPSPSVADETLTRHIRDAIRSIDVRLIDHWVFGESVFSFSEHGLL